MGARAPIDWQAVARVEAWLEQTAEDVGDTVSEVVPGYPLRRTDLLALVRAAHTCPWSDTVKGRREVDHLGA